MQNRRGKRKVRKKSPNGLIGPSRQILCILNPAFVNVALIPPIVNSAGRRTDDR
jgi:hypothetical protein